jgi:hypothetical protein
MWSIKLDGEVPPKEILRRAIDRLRNGAPNPGLSERRKLASLRMNLRIIESLHGPDAPPDGTDGNAGCSPLRGGRDDTDCR